jgi:hypothetical protein
VNQRFARITTLAGCWLLIVGLSIAHGESDGQVEHVTRSPDGTFRVEQQIVRGEGPKQPASLIKVWIIPTAEPAKRVALGEPFDDAYGRAFFISPDGQWLCATVHFHSQLDGVMLYRRKAGFQFELVTTDECEMGHEPPNWEFDSGDRFVDTSDWEDTAGVHDYFVAWSVDSTRLLVEKRMPGRNAAGKRVVSRDFFYFNLRSGKLEHTKYLRNVTQILPSEEAKKYVVPGFAEPLDTLRPEKEILARYEAAERRLNKSFPAVIELQSSEEEKGEFQKYQRLWLKARDSGAEAFAALGSKEQRRCRNLQYLADATENRARDLEEYLENHVQKEE